VRELGTNDRRFFLKYDQFHQVGWGMRPFRAFYVFGCLLGQVLIFLSPSFHTTIAQSGLSRTTAKAPPDPMRSVPVAINASLDEKASPAPFPLGRPVPRAHGVQPKVQIPVHGTEVSIAHEFCCAVVFIATSQAGGVYQSKLK